MAPGCYYQYCQHLFVDKVRRSFRLANQQLRSTDQTRATTAVPSYDGDISFATPIRLLVGVYYLLTETTFMWAGLYERRELIFDWLAT